MEPWKYLGAMICVLCLFLSSIKAHFTDVRYCNKETDYAVKINGVDITPYPISRGRKTTFAISAQSNETITDAEVMIDVSYLGFHVHNENHDICEEVKCPVSAGDFVMSHTRALPVITPPGSYTLTMKIIVKNKMLTCFSFDFSIGFWAPVNLSPL